MSFRPWVWIPLGVATKRIKCNPLYQPNVTFTSIMEGILDRTFFGNLFFLFMVKYVWYFGFYLVIRFRSNVSVSLWLDQQPKQISIPGEGHCTTPSEVINQVWDRAIKNYEKIFYIVAMTILQQIDKFKSGFIPFPLYRDFPEQPKGERKSKHS